MCSTRLYENIFKTINQDLDQYLPKLSQVVNDIKALKGLRSLKKDTEEDGLTGFEYDNTEDKKDLVKIKSDLGKLESEVKFMGKLFGNNTLAKIQNTE